MNTRQMRMHTFSKGRMLAVGGTPPLRCAPGRHVGPFVRADKYDAHPDTVWRGFMDCAACGSTVHTPQEAA